MSNLGTIHEDPTTIYRIDMGVIDGYIIDSGLRIT